MCIELIEYILNEELTISLETIDAAYQRQNWEQFKALVHKFKSSCLYCATTALLDLTQQLEKSALLDDYGYCLKIFNASTTVVI